MNSIPTGGPATSPDGDDPEVTEVDGSSAAERGAGVPPIPAPRSGDDPLPQRTRPRTGAARGGTGPGRDPDGRPYAAPDAATLDRLLSGLRDI